MGDDKAQEFPTPSSLREQIDETIDKLVEEDCRQDTDSTGHECNIVTELFVIDLKAAVTTYIEAEKLTAAHEAVKANNELHKLHERNVELVEIEALQNQLDEILEWSKFGARHRLNETGRRAIADLHEYRTEKLQAQKAVLEEK